MFDALLRRVPGRFLLRWWLLLATATTLLAAGSRLSPRGGEAGGTCTVEMVLDGDTLACEDNRRIRLIGIDAPESGQRPFAGRARAALLAVAPIGTSLRIETDVTSTDRYGRTLAYLWTRDGALVNEVLAERGYVVALTIPPNVRYADRIRAAVRRARTARPPRGLWASSAFDCAPADFRAGRCS